MYAVRQDFNKLFLPQTIVATSMIITITLPSPPVDKQKLPPPLAKISHDEYVLIELQGTVNVECNDAADRNGQLVGNLRIDEVGVRRIQ